MTVPDRGVVNRFPHTTQPRPFEGVRVEATCSRRGSPLRGTVPRYQALAETPGSGGVEFDLCARCAENPDILLTVVAKKIGLPLDAVSGARFAQKSHISYDFSTKPVPCFSCARILSATDD